MTKMPTKGREDHAAEDRRTDVAPRQLRGAGGHHQRQQAEDEGERRHHHRPEPQPRALGRGLEQRHALLALLLGELDDQDAVLGCEADQHHHADLPVEIERQTPPTTIAANEPSMPTDTDSSTGTGMVQLS